MKTLLQAIGVSLCLSHAAMAAVTDIADKPIESSVTVPPAIILGLDDSGSMDFETNLPTSGGALWWETSAKSYYNSAGTSLLYNESGDWSWDWPRYWVGHYYLFPNGVSQDARLFTDASYGANAIPPIPSLAFTRSPDYNPLYYDTNITYKPWVPAYINGSVMTFSNANPQAARSHPVFTNNGTPTTINLTQTQYSEADGWVFRMTSGMVIPGDDISGIRRKEIKWGYSPWQDVNSNWTIPDFKSYYVAIPYYPATFYLKDASCVSGPDCFTTYDGYKLRRYEIKPGNTFPSGRSYSDEIQNFANWFTYHRKRKLLIASVIGEVLGPMRGIRVGMTLMNNLSTVTMYDFDSVVDSQNSKRLLAGIYTNVTWGGTPIRKMLGHMGEQFSVNSSIITSACQMNAALVVTDGYANGLPAVPPIYNKSTWGSQPPYSATHVTTLADLALGYYTKNPRPSFPTGQVSLEGNSTGQNIDTNHDLHVNTYGFSFGLRGEIYGTASPSYADPFANPPNWPIPLYNGNPSSIDDLWHATINGRGLMFEADNLTTAKQAFNQAFGDVLLKAGAGSAIGLTKTYFSSADSIAYIASYSGLGGNLKAVTANPSTGAVNINDVQWNAQGLLDAKAHNNRVIVTYNGASGIPFRWTNLPTDQKNALHTSSGSADGHLVLEYLRGDRSHEGSSYRQRAHVLGDIVYSEPLVVTNAEYAYSDDGYAAFKNSIATRDGMIYVGSNDGMLHAFDKATGQERWAYVPKAVFANLNDLSKPSYSHKFYVDGTPTIGDVYMNSSWKTILVGGLRAGGSGFYAIDITDPSAMTTEAGVAAKVLWEFPNNSTPTSVINNLGKSFGKPIIAKTAAYGWVVLVTSGYNNTSGDGRGHLFVLNPATGAVVRDIVTSEGTSSTPAGLAQIAAYAPNGRYDATITAVYGGDVLGNVWRFDLSGDSIAGWSVTRLARLVDSGGSAQPVTIEPEIAEYNGKRIIYVGTGLLLGMSHFSTTQTQTIYALYDDLSATPEITPLRSQLAARAFTNNTIEGPSLNENTDKGWYFDLPGTGERISVNPLLAFGGLLFNTNQPSATACSSQSFAYLVNFVDGLPIAESEFSQGNAWVRASVGNTLVSRPTVVTLTSGEAIAISHKSDNTVVSFAVPQTSTGQISKIAWKEILRQ